MNFKPQIAIITPNSFEAMGLADIISKMMPMSEACIFSDADQLIPSDAKRFFHFFVSSDIIFKHADFFLPIQQQTIMIVHGDDNVCTNAHFKTINASLPKEQLIKSLLQLIQHGHGRPDEPQNEVVKQAEGKPYTAAQLTPREQDVLRLVAKGMLNKEIADELHVALTTVISHRKNLTQKIGIKSVSALTIYAVMHGLVKLDEI